LLQEVGVIAVAAEQDAGAVARRLSDQAQAHVEREVVARDEDGRTLGRNEGRR
jgi:hypothetical protein